jgi:hypothetical protein
LKRLLFFISNIFFFTLFSQHTSAQSSSWGWLYCVNSTKPHSNIPGDWNYAQYQNFEELKSYANFVSPYSSWLYPTGGIALLITKLYTHIQLIKIPDIPKNSKNHKILPKFFLFEDHIYAIVDHTFETIEQGKAFCQALQNKCRRDFQNMGAVGYGFPGSTWMGISAKIKTGALVYCEARFPLNE